MNFGGRQMGKSTAMQMLKEAKLDAGHSVITIRPDCMIKERRVKHLTMIESVPYGDKSPIQIVYDEWSES